MFGTGSAARPKYGNEERMGPRRKLPGYDEPIRGRVQTAVFSACEVKNQFRIYSSAGRALKKVCGAVIS